MHVELTRAVLRAARMLVPAMALAAAGTIATGAPALGHGETFFQVGAERIQPGGQVEIRFDLGTGDAFEIALVSKADGSRRVIATVGATEEGHYQGYVTVPSDVPAGDYLVEAAVDLVVARAPLTVAGPPIVDGAGGAPEHEGFPQPSGVAGGLDGTTRSAAPTTAAVSTSVRGQRDSAESLAIVGVATVAAVALVGALRLRRRIPRSRS
jgi:hypothetical protein